MVHPALIAAAVATGAGILTSQISSVTETDYWYDIYNYYYVFPEEYTDLIDSMLSDPQYGKLGVTKVMSASRRIPHLGVHYYYRYRKNERWWFSRNFIGLIKIEEDVGDQKVCYYMCFVSPTYWGNKTFEVFGERIFKPNANTVRVVSIDLSQYAPRTMYLTKICRDPKPNQQQIIDFIMARWTPKNDYNVKTVICGTSGLGKTYTGMLVKKHIDNAVPNVSVRLYDDFDPSAVGVNIKNLALKYASITTPVILVINEIDILYDKVFNEEPTHDPREQHTKDKTTFNNMLDALASMQYVITIFTTEKSPEELYANQQFRSFMRPGRVDFFVKMGKNRSTFVDNDLSKKKTT